MAGTFFVDASGGMRGAGISNYGGEEELWAKLDGREPPITLYRPCIGNIAPRSDGWSSARSNTQQPPRSGPAKNQRPAAQQPRAPMFGGEVRKVLP